MKFITWFVASCCILACRSGASREFGPEWRRGTAGEYQKDIVVPVTNFGRGGGSGYSIQLESDQITIVERDENRGFYLESPAYGHFEVYKDKKGAPAWYLIRFLKIQYWDLNGDGVFDMMQDRRGPFPNAFTEQITYIFLDHCFVEVWGAARGGNYTTAAFSPDRKIRYVFEDGNWKVKK